MKLFGKKPTLENSLYAIASGTQITLEEVKDPVFSEKMMGDGIAFLLTDGTIKSPGEGVVIFVSPTTHALGLKMDNDMEILIHIGLETVSLGGAGFDRRVNVNERVKTGTTLVKVDRDYMKKRNIDLTTIMIVTNWKLFDYTLSNVGQVFAGKSEVITNIKKKVESN